jgi:MGT family glycosyltransferase
MAHFSLVCPDDAGHLLPIGAVGGELQRRGHRVTVIARAKAAPLAAQLGLAFCELKTEGVPSPSSYLLWRVFRAFGAAWMIGMRCAFEWDALVMLRKLPAMVRELKIDGLLIDQNFAAGGTAAELAGVPFVTVCSALMWHEEPGVPPPFTPWPYRKGWPARLRNRLGFAAWHWYMHPVMKVINRERKARGLSRLARVDDVFSPLAQLSNLCAEFDYPRRALPAHFHYIGSFAAGRQVNTDHQFPWPRLNGRPLIFASLGTIPDAGNPPVFRKVLAACAGLDAQLVLALGNWKGEHGTVREQLGPVPDNALVVDFAPQMALLDRAALLITHGGSNTVLEALSRGVPMVALPRSADQMGMAARVVHCGAGLRASFKKCTSEELRRLVQRGLCEDALRQRAGQLRQAMQAAGGAPRAAEIAETALTAGRPVSRQ